MVRGNKSLQKLIGLGPGRGEIRGMSKGVGLGKKGLRGRSEEKKKMIK